MHVEELGMVPRHVATMSYILAIVMIFVSFFVDYICIYLQVLTVLCNVAEKGPAYCQRLWPGPLLPTLLHTLAFSDTEVVGQSLELLHLLFLYQPEAVQVFLQQSGLQALERHQEEAQLQDRVYALRQTALQG